ncbi:MAG: hypothetical protein QOK28_361 [Actinomycetota bacterium]|jgi:hypothetical protein
MSLCLQLQAALDADLEALAGAPAVDERDVLETLLFVYDLHLAPLDRLGGCEHLANHPVVAEIKWRFDRWLIDALDVRLAGRAALPADTVEAVRHIAMQHDDAVYDWLATTADWYQLRMFLAVEGGPDAGFDDLVALCQVGIRGGAKVVLGENYWDEMGRGDAARVHTTLHDKLVDAIGMPTLSRPELPLSALFRSALSGLLATNHWLQPEMLGALGVIEQSAGPRCRRVVRAMERLGAPEDAMAFYREHATTDPRHGKEWLDRVIGPLVAEHPEWGERIVRGALWRRDVDCRLLRDLHEVVATRELELA